MMERSEKKALITSLAKSPHGNLAEYAPVAARVIDEDADFYAHLVAWNHRKGQIRDAKVALPVLALTDPQRDTRRELIESALAHMADLNPRLFLKALTFVRALKAGLPATPAKPDTRKGVPVDSSLYALGHAAVAARPTIAPVHISSKMVRRLVTRYLYDLEADARAWNGTTVRHRATMRTLYAWYGVPSARAKAVLFEETERLGPFKAINELRDMTADQAAGAIERYKLPFLIARGAVGAKAKEVSVAMALIKAATPTELVTNVKAFERLGVKTVPALRAAFEEALAKAGKAHGGKATLKTTRAAEALEADGETKLAGKLRDLQEKQLDNLGGIEGDWLVLGDKSGSMHASIEGARVIAATLARMAKGKVYLVFFDTTPRFFDVTGKSYEDLVALSKTITAGGGTSIGCGLQLLFDKKLSVDGIAVVSDGGENTPPRFPAVYQQYCEKLDVTPSVYFYQLQGEANAFGPACVSADIDVQLFDLRGSTVDYYSLPNLAQTMRVGRYSLIDEVLSTPLLTLDAVLERTKGMTVLRDVMVTA